MQAQCKPPSARFVRRLGISFRVDRDAFDLILPQHIHYPRCNLASVGDQDRLKHSQLTHFASLFTRSSRHYHKSKADLSLCPSSASVSAQRFPEFHIQMGAGHKVASCLDNRVQPNWPSLGSLRCTISARASTIQNPPLHRYSIDLTEFQRQFEIDIDTPIEPLWSASSPSTTNNLSPAIEAECRWPLDALKLVKLSKRFAFALGRAS